MEERSEGILLRPTGPVVEKLSWEETAQQMAAEDPAGQGLEEWGDWEVASSDGLDDLPWDEESTEADPARSRKRPAPRR